MEKYYTVKNGYFLELDVVLSMLNNHLVIRQIKENEKLRKLNWLENEFYSMDNPKEIALKHNTNKYKYCMKILTELFNPSFDDTNKMDPTLLKDLWDISFIRGYTEKDIPLNYLMLGTHKNNIGFVSKTSCFTIKSNKEFDTNVYNISGSVSSIHNPLYVTKDSVYIIEPTQLKMVLSINTSGNSIYNKIVKGITGVFPGLVLGIYKLKIPIVSSDKGITTLKCTENSIIINNNVTYKAKALKKCNHLYKLDVRLFNFLSKYHTKKAKLILAEPYIRIEDKYLSFTFAPYGDKK